MNATNAVGTTIQNPAILLARLAEKWTLLVRTAAYSETHDAQT